MIYLICFLIAFLTLFYLINSKTTIEKNVVILNVVIIIGTGGYYALYASQNLSEAILANIMTYSIGCFAPMIMFLIICNICRISIKTWIQTVLYFIQTIIFLSVCTSGKSNIFYKKIEYHVGNSGAYITKAYGPMHTVYIVMMCLFMFASIAIVGDSIRVKRCRISILKANLMLFQFLISAILYFVERFSNINFELMPIVFTITNLCVTIIFVNISVYSAYGNLSILENKTKDIAYIVFSRKLMYMSCNDYAIELFPELEEWEREKSIPGNGGRFNTFLRIPFMNYVNSEIKDKYVSGFSFDGKYYRVEISLLTSPGEKIKGYVIEVALDVVKTRELNEIS